MRDTAYRPLQANLELFRAAAEATHLNDNGRVLGHRGVQAALFDDAGIRAPRADVLEVLRMQDAAALQAQREGIQPRQTYNVRQAMHVWHFGGDRP